MFLTTLFSTLLPFATADTVVKDTVVKWFSLLPIPVVYYTPETRLGYGVGLTATFRFRHDSLVSPRLSTLKTLPARTGGQTGESRPSQISLGAAYTQNKQLLFFIPFQVFYDHDNYYINGEIGYYRYSYYFYGIGQHEIPRELYGVNFVNTKLNVFRRIASLPKRGKLYAGVRHQYEDFVVTTVTPEGLLATGTVAGGRGNRRSALGLGVFYDSRDRVFFPSKGIVADLTYLHNRWTPSGQTDVAPTQYDRYVAEVSSYHALAGQKLILALNYVASFTANSVSPFNDLSQLGSSKRMRGYYEGRYRDQNIALLQSEMRFDIYKRLGGVVFGAVGWLGDSKQLLRTNDPKGAYGLGLRFTANRRDHVNIRVDYGIGKQSSGLYVTIGEAF